MIPHLSSYIDTMIQASPTCIPHSHLFWRGILITIKLLDEHLQGTHSDNAHAQNKWQCQTKEKKDFIENNAYTMQWIFLTNLPQCNNNRWRGTHCIAVAQIGRWIAPGVPSGSGLHLPPASVFTLEMANLANPCHYANSGPITLLHSLLFRRCQRTVSHTGHRNQTENSSNRYLRAISWCSWLERIQRCFNVVSKWVRLGWVVVPNIKGSGS